MIKKENIQKFISNDFEKASLIGRYVDNHLQTRLTLSGSRDNFYTISSYGNDIDELRKDEVKCCNKLLDSFLENNSIYTTIYDSYNKYHQDKFCIEIGNGDKRLNLAFQGDITKVFLDILKRIEGKKSNDVMNEFYNNLDEIEFLKIKSYSIYSSQCSFEDGQFTFEPLMLKSNDGIILYEPDKELLSRIVEDYLLSIGINNATYRAFDNMGLMLIYRAGKVNYIYCDNKILQGVVMDAIDKLHDIKNNNKIMQLKINKF